MCDVILYLQVNDEIKLLKKYALKKKDLSLCILWEKLLLYNENCFYTPENLFV